MNQYVDNILHAFAGLDDDPGIAADEIAVQAFLEGRIRFPRICDVIRATLDEAELEEPVELESVLALDAHGRRLAQRQVERAF